MIGSFDTSTHPFTGKCECISGESSAETGAHTGRLNIGAYKIATDTRDGHEYRHESKY